MVKAHEQNTEKDDLKTERDALNKAIRFINYRPRSSGEIIERLLRYGYDPNIIDSIVKQLKESSLVDDLTFARTFMEEMIEKGFGLNRVRKKLFDKRLDRPLIDEVTSCYPYDEEADRAYLEGLNRAKRLPARDRNLKNDRIKAHLKRLGYSSEIAERACRRIQVDSNLERE